MKKYISLILCGSLLLTACGSTDSSSVADKNDVTSSASDLSSDVSSMIEDKSGIAEQTETKAETMSSIDNNLGINSLHVNDSGLSDDQKMLISYTDNNYFDLYNYELIQRYPDAFNNAQVVFTGKVEKVLNADDKTYSILATLNEMQGNDMVSKNKIVINGNHSDNYSDVAKNYRIIEGDQFKCFGVAKGSETVSTGNDSAYLPVFDANQIIVDNGIGHYLRYNISFIKELANAVFPKGIKIREPIQGQDFDTTGSWDGIHDTSDMFLIGEPDNQSNANFTKYEFYQSRGYIRDNKSTKDIIRQLKMSIDMQHYILTIYDSSMKNLTIEYYDLDYNKIWSRDFSNAEIYNFSTMADNRFFDYTESTIYLDLNNDLYIIDIETGEDKISPVTIGEKIDIRKTTDSILLVSDKKTDSVVKTDLEGNILWKLDIPLYDDELKKTYEDMGAEFNVGVRAVQVDDTSIRIEYYYIATKENSDYNYKETLYSAYKVFMIDNDGNLIMNTEIL